MAIDETKLNKRAKWQLEAVTRWGQRVEPKLRAILVQHAASDSWSELHAGTISDADTIGVYLGEKTVMVFSPLDVAWDIPDARPDQELVEYAIFPGN